jgi:hypothetical protein
MVARSKEGANGPWTGLGRPAWAHPGPVCGLLCLMSVPVSSRCFPLLHVGPCHQFLSELDVAPCLTRFGTFLVRSSEFVIFSGWVPSFLESSVLHCMTCTGFKVLSQGAWWTYPESLAFNAKPCINTKLQNRHAQVNLLYHGGLY